MKRKVKIFLFLIFLTIVIYSCQQTERYHSITTVDVDVASNSELKLSKYFENFRMLKLPSDSVIGEINRIRYDNNLIYISDKRTMFIFSNSGELLSSFTKRGRGPGEYSSITDFTVDGNEIIILDRSLRKLLVYNHFGECISNRSLEYWAQAISPVVNNIYFLYFGTQYNDNNEGHKLCKVKFGQEESLYLDIDKNKEKYLRIFSRHNFYHHKESIYFFEALNDTVYNTVEDGSMQPLFYVDYKGKNIPSSFFKKGYTDILNFFEEFNMTSYAYGVVDFVVNDHFLMFGSYYCKFRFILTPHSGQC